ncbi:DUF3306 domain-containing protein [Photobacterium nomapromontoriensis]|uniref:DUF3306 domain-containing protein n=1 Tax=Photobacterium nomapromontoriensis TaxID=2910237 RepID=UPI003D114D18
MASNFFQRWSSRKLQAKEEKTKDVEDVNVAIGHETNLVKETVLEPEISNAATSIPDEAFHYGADNGERSEHSEQDDSSDAPVAEESALTLDDVVKVTFDSGVTSFMKEGVEKSVKKAALRKLFHSDEFNYISDMDDHTEDFSNIPALNADEVKGLRNWITEVAENINDALATTSEPLPTAADGIESGVEMPQSLTHYSEQPMIRALEGDDLAAEDDTPDGMADNDANGQTVIEPTSAFVDSAVQENEMVRHNFASKK